MTDPTKSRGRHWRTLARIRVRTFLAILLMIGVGLGSARPGARIQRLAVASIDGPADT